MTTTTHRPPPAAALPELPLLPGAAATAAARALRRPREVRLDRPVHRYVLDTASRDPGRTAVTDSGRSTDYRTLARRAAALATRLRADGLRPGQVLAAAGPRSADTVTVFLAADLLGAVYLPVDPAWPAARTAEVLRRSGAARLLDYTGAPDGPAAAAAAGADVPVARHRDAEEDPGDPADPCGPADPAYLIFTSGTTGTPKGAVVERRGMLNHLWAKLDDLGITERDTLAFTSPLVFDISVWQMLAPLLAGGTVAVVRDAQLGHPRRLAAALRRDGATVVELVPTMAGWLADEAARPGGTRPEPRMLVSTGEELRPALARRIADAFPGTALFNAYGPTECSDDVTHHRVTAEDLALPRLPVGRPIANAVLYVLVDGPDGWRAAGPGESGDLFVGGLPVGRGYVNDPATTARAFFADPFDAGSPTGRLYRTGDLARIEDGVVHYLGRDDRQVKVAGVRMELDEVELMLGRHPALAACAVTAVGDDLAAHYVPLVPVTQSELRAFLKDLLPAGQIPRSWHEHTKLPLTANGKTDHRRLAEAHSPKGDR
ncbi:amino acid adenylation domain-containing protein [Streptomyces sp. NPDC057682]|uniref:amino acid adenylation domain-containing protein n=1 Tax=Streptomyces sp. NPDC057682 TaxID=3346210 RepID=UPI0036CE634A